VGLFGESFFAARASGKVKAIVIVHIPSMKTQHCDVMIKGSAKMHTSQTITADADAHRLTHSVKVMER
jgi:hypothetical protein